LTIIDGVLAGEGEGPLAPTDVALGAILAGTDPVAVDLLAVRLMGFDEQKLAKLREPMADDGPRITAIRSSGDVRVGVAEIGSEELRDRSLEEISWERGFVPHAGWIGQVERDAE
jgi:uncharacterized protein (DUF362 family)